MSGRNVTKHSKRKGNSGRKGRGGSGRTASQRQRKPQGAMQPEQANRATGGVEPTRVRDDRMGAGTEPRGARGNGKTKRTAERSGRGARGKGGYANAHDRARGKSGNAASRSRSHSTAVAASVCPVSAQCGACTCIDEPYAHQLERKQAYVAGLFEGVAPASCELLPILGMDDPFRFRDKIASPFAPVRGKHGAQGRAQQGAGKRKQRGIPASSIACGMYAAHSHRIIEVNDCPVEAAAGRRIVHEVRRLMAKWGVAPYDEDAGTGFMRHVVVRVGHESGEVLVTLVTNAKEFPSGRNFARELAKRCPEITTVVQNVNLRATNAILGNEEHVLYGPGFILDTLCGLSFRISSHSFYQVNARQTEVLYRCAVEMAGLGQPLASKPAAGSVAPTAPDAEVLADKAGNVDPSSTDAHEAAGAAGGAELAVPAASSVPATAQPLAIMDAYCGTGTIGLVAARASENVQVTGVDNVASAIRDARQNATHNGIENARFICDDATAYMRHMAAAGERLDVLLMDPPRAGSTREFVEAACALSPERVVYISCNPETQARDAAWFKEHSYLLQRIRPVDMFPHTDHVETVALLAKARA